MFSRETFKNYLKENKKNLIREVRFLAVVFIWVAVFVGLIRSRWTRIEENELRSQFVEATRTASEKLEKRLDYWETQSRKIAAFVADQPPSTIRLQQDSWTAIYDAHPEWLATHVVQRRQGFDSITSVSLMSRQVRDLLPQENDTPVRWPEEAQTSAMQLTSSREQSQRFIMQFVRSIDKQHLWVQVLFKIKQSKPGWSTWVVQTFNEKVLPEVLETAEDRDGLIHFHTAKKTLISKNFANHKIERSEILSLIEKNNGNASGFSEQRFAIAKKDFWLGWHFSKGLDATVVKILPNEHIPTTGSRETPSWFADFLLTLLWMSISAMTLWWSHSKGLWRLSISEPPAEIHPDIEKLMDSDPYHKNKHKTLESMLSSPTATEREFCRHLLSDVGPIGDIPLAGDARAVVEASPAPHYKGTWWIIQNIDDQRVLVAVGDASGEGLAAGTAAYSVRHFIEVIIQRECRSRDTESFLSLVYDLCDKATEGVLLGSAHVSLFAGILDLEKQKLCFINAGFPSPLLKLGNKKQLALASYADPIGLGVDGPPLPRWLNVPFESNLVLCNIGARNVDLDELEESELIKIYVFPYGAKENSDVIGDNEAA